MPIVTLTASTGLAALIAEGYRVALAREWRATDGRAFAGWWLGMHVRLAQLTGGSVRDEDDALHVTLGSGDRQGGMVELARAIVAGLESLRAGMAPVEVPEEITVSVAETVEVQRDTGYLAAVAIVAGAGVVAWGIWRASEVLSEVFARNAQARQLAADMVTLDGLAARHAAAVAAAGRDLELDPVTRTQVAAVVSRSQALTDALRSSATSSSSWVAWSIPVAAAVAAAVLIWKG